jgi:hypothetical protein
VTRIRYGRFLPPVSTCVRMLGSPIIDPQRSPQAAVDLIRALAPAMDHGVVLFAEGHRSRDGGVRPFKSAGAQAILEARPMPVWVVATDGLGSLPRLVDFVFNAHRMRSRTVVLGRIEGPAGADVATWIQDVRAQVVEAIERMRAQPGLTPPALAEAVRTRSLPAGEHEGTRAARALAEAAGGEVDAVVFFGSRKTGARPDAHSALDFFVVVRDERRFYRALRGAGLVRRGPRLLAALGRLLPPTSISLTLPGADGPVRSKSAVLSGRAFARETSAGRRDHFMLGRLFQPAEVVYARDEDARRQTLQALARAHALAYRWGRPWLPPRFDVDAFARTLLRVSFAGEIRPEPVARRVETLWQAQQDGLRAVYGVLLRELALRGDLHDHGDGSYSPVRPVGAGERARLWLYFRWSMARATARWAKHVVSFEGWLDFLVRKARRHTGAEIELTARERRAPLLFLWPRVWRYLRQKDR